jgi:hypothetical protein
MRREEPLPRERSNEAAAGSRARDTVEFTVASGSKCTVWYTLRIVVLVTRSISDLLQYPVEDFTVDAESLQFT